MESQVQHGFNHGETTSQALNSNINEQLGRLTLPLENSQSVVETLSQTHNVNTILGLDYPKNHLEGGFVNAGRSPQVLSTTSHSAESTMTHEVRFVTMLLVHANGDIGKPTRSPANLKAWPSR